VLRVNTRPAATNGLLQNVATADAGARATSPLVTHQVREGVDLSINKRATGVTPPAPPITDGQLISYTVEASNPGPLAATAVTVTDFLPPGTQLVSSTPPTTTQSGQTVNWTFPNLAAGETRQINLTVRVLTGTNAISLTNRARVSSATPEINPVNNDAIADVPGNAAPVDATAQKSGPPRAIAGETFVYRILVTTVNGGDNIVVTDTLPAGLTLVPELTNPPALGTAPTYYWNLGRMAPGTNRTVEVGVRVSPGITVGTTLNNSAEVAGGTGTIRPPRGSNPAQTQIVRPSNLSLSKAVAQPGTFTPGGNVTFTLTVRNNDAVNPSGVITVTDNLPAGFTVVSTNPAANVTGSTVRWNIASVPAGGTLNLLLVAQVPANFTGNSFSNQAQLETDLPDTQPIVTSNPVNVPRFGLTANLAIDKTGPAGPLARGQPFAYTIEVRNDGSVEATGIVISDTLPAGLTYVSASPAPASQNPLRWQIGSLAPNARVNITLIVQLAADYSGSAISNQASVGSQSADGDQTNNFSVRTIPIQAPPASATPAVTALGTTPTPTAAGGGGGGGANTPTPTAATGTTAAVTTVAGSGTPAPNTTVAISATPTATSGGGGDGGTTPGANATPTALPGVPNTGQPPADNSNFDELFWRFMLGLGLIAGGGWLFWSGRRERQRNRN
jgi:large repetitive protein